MNEYVMSDLVLTKDETIKFINNMIYPQDDTIARRNKFISEVANSKRTINSDGSFNVDIPSLDLSFLDDNNELEDQYLLTKKFEIEFYGFSLLQQETNFFCLNEKKEYIIKEDTYNLKSKVESEYANCLFTYLPAA